MFDPATFGIAFLIVCAVHVYIREHRRERQDEFDGGFRHDHPRVTTTIYSKHVKQRDD
jgi:hypothetical protein